MLELFVNCDSVSNVFCNLWQDDHVCDNENTFEFEVSANGNVVNCVFVIAIVAIVLLDVINSEFVWQGLGLLVDFVTLAVIECQSLCRVCFW